MNYEFFNYCPGETTVRPLYVGVDIFFFFFNCFMYFLNMTFWLIGGTLLIIYVCFLVSEADLIFCRQ